MRLSDVPSAVRLSLLSTGLYLVGVIKSVKTALRQLLPRCMLDSHARMKLARKRQVNQKKTVKEVFTDIYENNEWGGRGNEYSSGPGSSEHHAFVYAEAVKAFIVDRGVTTVVDLGCGDFVVGRKLQMEGVKYIGVDIVEDLIERNERHYADASTMFLCKDIISDELPEGDLCLIRQVLQHLSNSEIASILSKVKQYSHVMITEHYPPAEAKYVANRDKPHGSDTRVIDHSAVYLDEPPFNMSDLSLVLEVEIDEELMKGEMLRTFLIENSTEPQRRPATISQAL